MRAYLMSLLMFALMACSDATDDRVYYYEFLSSLPGTSMSLNPLNNDLTFTDYGVRKGICAEISGFCIVYAVVSVTKEGLEQIEPWALQNGWNVSVKDDLYEGYWVTFIKEDSKEGWRSYFDEGHGAPLFISSVKKQDNGRLIGTGETYVRRTNGKTEVRRE